MTLNKVLSFLSWTMLQKGFINKILVILTPIRMYLNEVFFDMTQCKKI